ncbi:hypothetical protein AGLY_009384 [Aphis glycines]|uniref:Uncharacterized protein n=1 Tax=Aphis glycines TaxID=307491 RepID=A0A6G0THA4_APHGL|nr:hypothetical protein AGLY_009384 [Aphis glycines]
MAPGDITIKKNAPLLIPLGWCGNLALCMIEFRHRMFNPSQAASDVNNKINNNAMLAEKNKKSIKIASSIFVHNNYSFVSRYSFKDQIKRQPFNALIQLYIRTNKAPLSSGLQLLDKKQRTEESLRNAKNNNRFYIERFLKKLAKQTFIKKNSLLISKHFNIETLRKFIKTFV